MKTESEFTLDFRKLLVERKGFPAESLILDYKISPRSRVDMLIVECRKLTPLAIVEIVRSSATGVHNKAYQAAQYLAELGQPVSGYLISYGHGGFKAFRFEPSSKSFEEIDFDSLFPDYASLTIGRATLDVQSAAKKKKASVDHLKVACYLLASVLSLLLFLMKSGLIVFTPEDLLLVAGIVALCIIPHAAELKLLGVEYKAKQIDTTENTKK